MADFDPDAYLSQVQPQQPAFDPDAYLASAQAPSLPNQIVQPRMGLADMLFDPETAQNLRGAVQDVVYSLPGMATQIPKMAYEGLKFAAGGPQERAQVGTEALSEAVAQGQQMSKDVMSPMGSRESFRGIANLGLMAAPAVGEVLGEAALLGKKPPIQGEALPQIPETPISPTVKPITEVPTPSAETPTTVGETTATRQAAPIEQPAQGFVRLYHGGGEAAGEAGRDFTTSKQYAEDYAAKAEADRQGKAKVWSVDIPEGSLKTHDETGQPMTRVVVPDEVRNQATPASEVATEYGPLVSKKPTGESGVETPPTVSETTTGADTGSKPVEEANQARKEAGIGALPQKATAAAVQMPDGKIFSSVFHADAAEQAVASGYTDFSNAVRGFVDRDGKFFTVKNFTDVPRPESLKDTGAPPVAAPVSESGLESSTLVTEKGTPKAPTTAAPPEPPASEGEGRTTGIAQRITNAPANEGLSVQESVDRGQNLLSEGVNPEEVSARVKTSKQLSVDDLSVLRARTSELDKAAYAAEDAMRANPKDPAARQAWEDAVKARNDWNTDHVKPAQTIWSDLGRTQQGEADIDTGTVTGLRVAFNEAKGRDPTPIEQEKLTDYADKTKNVEGQVDEAKSKYDQAIGKQSGAGGVPTTEALQEHFLSKITDPNAKSYPFTQGEISDLWKYTKANYIDKGVTSLDDTIHMVSLDTGLPPEWVTDALTKPKAIKSVTNELYSAMSKRRDIVNAAKDYIRAKDEPLWKKVAKAVWETPFSLAIYGHGTVGGITHAGANIFRPSVWKAYWPDFVNQAKFFAKPGIHEAAMQRLVRDPNFITGKRAGLANDPNLTYTDYGAYAKFFGLQGGRRGFDALKTMRQSMFNSMWDKVPESIKSDRQASKELAKGYAEMVNHATGVISNTDRGFLGTSSRAMGPLMFAAKLEASRWARVVGDPIKTLDTYAQWGKATPAEKAVAIKRTKNAAEFTAAFLGTLYLNQQILSSSGSKDKINFSDPSKSDWLKHKIAGHTVAVDGGLLSPIRLLGRLTYDTLIRPRKELRGDTRTAAAIKDVGQYAIGKASPSISIAKEAVTAESFDGRLLPWSRDTSKKPRMTWPEYASSHGPIPISGGIKDAYDSMRQRGMSKPDTEAVLRGLAAFGSELTGARVMEIQEPQPKTNRNR